MEGKINLVWIMNISDINKEYFSEITTLLRDNGYTISGSDDFLTVDKKVKG